MDHCGFLWPYCVAALVGDCSSLVVPGVLIAHPWSQSDIEDVLELGSHLWCDGKCMGQPFVTLYLAKGQPRVGRAQLTVGGAAGSCLAQRCGHKHDGP